MVIPYHLTCQLEEPKQNIFFRRFFFLYFHLVENVKSGQATYEIFSMLSVRPTTLLPPLSSVLDLLDIQSGRTKVKRLKLKIHKQKTVYLNKVNIDISPLFLTPIEQELLHYVFIMRCFPATNGFKIYE
eukprot:sb/3475323/